MTPTQPAPAVPGELEDSVLPVVADTSSGIPTWLLLAGLGTLGIILFIILEARRTELVAPAVRARPADLAGRPESIPQLYIPPAPLPPAPFDQRLPPPMLARAQPQLSVPIAPRAQTAVPSAYVAPQTSYAPPVQVTPAQPARTSNEPVLVIDMTGAQADAGRGEGAQSANRASSAPGPAVVGSRAGAGVLANRSTTIPQGTVIAAVLETALDSTRPGLARAIVSKDVRGFDGRRILIPRGSRLIGEYAAEAKPGQKRMLVNWTRLIRPDGVTIAIGSPASDPLGRAGVRADVDNHFFQRFAGAILQSALDVGVNLASRSVNSPVLVALPSGVQQRSGDLGASNIAPTLKVRPATSISILAARDLDFTSVEASHGARR